MDLYSENEKSTKSLGAKYDQVYAYYLHKGKGNTVTLVKINLSGPLRSDDVVAEDSCQPIKYTATCTYT